MCGIAGFLSNDQWMTDPDTSWLDTVLDEIQEAIRDEQRWEKFERPLESLVDHYDDLMSFGFHLQLVRGTELLRKVKKLAELLEVALNKVERFAGEKGVSEPVEHVMDQIRDHAWQLREEVLGNADRAQRLVAASPRSDGSKRSRRYVAWAIQQVIENLDRLEVRGRDSAGIAVQCLLSEASGEILDGPPHSSKVEREVQRDFARTSLADGRTVVTFVYKVANLVGRLGDNTAALTRAIIEDQALWLAAGITKHVSVIAHTRWASNGIISLPNCHPTNGFLRGKDHVHTRDDIVAQFILNGDVDNYADLVEEYVRGKGYEIEPAITTDAKILPVFYRLGTNPNDSAEDRFAALMNACQGSLAIVMQHPLHPLSLILGQKGSGQSLFVGSVKDGFILASEVYGLASRTRRSFALSGTEKGGTELVLSSSNNNPATLHGRYLEDGSPFVMEPEPIYIHSRDIFRGGYDYYFEKEIHQSASSVRKTIKGKYLKQQGKIVFDLQGAGPYARLLSRFRDPSLPPVRRIIVMGQGTASVAADGVAHLIRLAVSRSKIEVVSCKASEMSGFLSADPLDDTLVIAISQSGTTTDTNRTVDVAGSKGAWIHAIVNRRNSPLVSKANSHTYTSDGRDVEMAVASTKAFYSQIAAGKLIALLLAAEMKTLSEQEILEDIEDLERLPSDIEWVLNQRDSIRECAEAYGPSSRNWAVVGNGPNKIAADEIRIKLSELCYKSIPCDFTEDKKHIDLSTEPLTIVVANDLPDQIVQDTTKEVAIFKAHNGKPIVLCTRGEKRFNPYAERVLELPFTGGGLGFVLATIAGHLWGFYAAKAIDAGAEKLRRVRAEMAAALERDGLVEASRLERALSSTVEELASGSMNAALSASTAASLAVFAARLRSAGETELRRVLEDGMAVLNSAVEDATRPIDTIRHQAKTVTVGISRPQEILPAVFATALEKLMVSPARLRESDRRLLRAVSPLVTDVVGGMLYKVVRTIRGGLVAVTKEAPPIQVERRFGISEGRPSRYDTASSAGGSKRTALRLERTVWSPGHSGMESLVVIPLFEDGKHQCDGLVLLHLHFADQASLDQKLGVLNAMGTRYHELVERLEELSGSTDLRDFLSRISPRDLMLLPIDGLVLSNI